MLNLSSMQCSLFQIPWCFETKTCFYLLCQKYVLSDLFLYSQVGLIIKSLVGLPDGQPAFIWDNKKSELKLMRRTRAYSSCCLQVLVHVHPFSRNSLLQPKIVKKSLKAPFLVFKVISVDTTKKHIINAGDRSLVNIIYLNYFTFFLAIFFLNLNCSIFSV